MSKELIDTSSMRPFPIASRMLGVNTFNTNKTYTSLPRFSTIPNPAVIMKVFFDFSTIAICFVAALYVNIAVLNWSLSLISPELPIACLWMYGLGFVQLLFVGYLEKGREEAWKVELRKRIVAGVDEKGDF